MALAGTLAALALLVLFVGPAVMAESSVGFLGVAGGEQPAIDAVAALAAEARITVDLNLVLEPPPLDPSLCTWTSSGNVIEQLFLALVDLDDETAEIRPELATSWSVSPDSTVYTFTLRSDATWSDGKSVTAADALYGILRTLEPATDAYYATTLYIIKNGEAFHTGSVTDPNLVGVTALNNTTLRIELEYPASYALSILSLTAARPMPQWAIEAHGVPTWTEAANIVTNGAYRLTEWAHDDYIILEKDQTHFDAADVQVARAKMWMVDEDAAWQVYVDGHMDSASVPGSVVPGPVLGQEVDVRPRACTGYCGLNLSVPPADELLVRKAFAAATDRQGLINQVYGGNGRPALTYTPPGIIGHVDGYVEGIGIPYNPVQARRWLADAGYPNGQGLLPITLWTIGGTFGGREEYLCDQWYATLGVSVTFASAWPATLWQMGWCMDYPDANNFVGDGVVRSDYAWTSEAYESLVSQAAREQDPSVRATLYAQAEEILVETDAVMIPLYYHASVIATKPFLERTYPTGGDFDIAKWRITRVADAIGPEGGILTSYDASTVVQIPPGAFTSTVVMTHTPTSGMPPSGNLAKLGGVFDLTAVYSDTGEPAWRRTRTLRYRWTMPEKESLRSLRTRWRSTTGTAIGGRRSPAARCTPAWMW